MFKFTKTKVQAERTFRFNIPFAHHDALPVAGLEQQKEGNANLIRAFGRTYGALLALADHGFHVVQAGLDSEDMASLEIAPPTPEQLKLLTNIRSLAVDRDTPAEGWLHMVDIGSFSLNRSGVSGVVVWWYSRENLPC